MLLYEEYTRQRGQMIKGIKYLRRQGIIRSIKKMQWELVKIRRAMPKRVI